MRMRIGLPDPDVRVIASGLHIVRKQSVRFSMLSF